MPGALFEDALWGELKCCEEMPPSEYQLYGYEDERVSSGDGDLDSSYSPR
jgi:hypothetical protein